jgi:hypothetical protein
LGRNLCGFFLTFLALQEDSQFLLTTLLGHDPRAILPRRVMPYMLSMTARQLRNPVIFFIQVKTDNCLLHSLISCFFKLPKAVIKMSHIKSP